MPVHDQKKIDSYRAAQTSYGADALPPNTWRVPENYTQVSSYDDTEDPNGANTGLKFTLYKNTSGHLIVAFAGTEPSQLDVHADIQYG